MNAWDWSDYDSKRIRRYIATIIEIIETLEVNIADIDRQLNTLRSFPICTGHPYYRDGDKLYCNHATGQGCPVHGDPHANVRLRIYIGKDPERVKRVLDAMSNYARIVDLEDQKRPLVTKLRRLTRNLHLQAL